MQRATKRYLGAALYCAAAVSLCFTALASAAPKVVVSISPVHSLVAGVMEGVGEPQLILRSYSSPHAYQLRPSDAKKLSDAAIIFWIGEPLETFLKRPLSTLGRRARVVALMETEGLRLLRNRNAGVWTKSIEEQTATNEEHYGKFDPHVWLDPDNVKLMVDKIARQLGAIDSLNAKTYRSNGANLMRRIDAMDQEAKKKLAPVKSIPYVVFHDAYQYFESHYGLNALGSITVGPERMPSARRLQDLRKKLRGLSAHCVFREPQFESALVETITEGIDVGHGILDPLGVAFEPGPDAYFDMMRANVSAIVDCLSKQVASDK